MDDSNRIMCAGLPERKVLPDEAHSDMLYIGTASARIEYSASLLIGNPGQGTSGHALLVPFLMVFPPARCSAALRSRLWDKCRDWRSSQVLMHDHVQYCPAECRLHFRADGMLVAGMNGRAFVGRPNAGTCL